MVGVTITKHETGPSGEYHAHVADSDHIGRLTWTARDGVHYADHTLVPPAIGGRAYQACSASLGKRPALTACT